jgi:hypothetical protein
MKTTPALETVMNTTERLDDAEHAQRDAIGAPFRTGASLGRIATKALLSHERLRRILRDPKRESPTAYRVAVERRGVTPLDAQLVVRADSKRGRTRVHERHAEGRPAPFGSSWTAAAPAISISTP